MALLYNEILINNLEDKINIHFNNKALLQRAVTHRSFANENTNLNLKNNERLEFLGDSVLSLIISTHIFHQFPKYPEGKLAKMRSVIVSEPVLAEKSREMGIGQFLLLGKGEEHTGGRKRDSILADTMEALIGAIYLDQGFIKARNFLINLFEGVIKTVERGEYIQDYKTMLQEIIQQKGKQGLSYAVVNETGPDHNKRFLIKVDYNHNTLGSGLGSTKKEAEQKAAMAALKKLGKL